MILSFWNQFLQCHCTQRRKGSRVSLTHTFGLCDVENGAKGKCYYIERRMKILASWVYGDFHTATMFTSNKWLKKGGMDTSDVTNARAGILWQIETNPVPPTPMLLMVWFEGVLRKASRFMCNKLFRYATGSWDGQNFGLLKENITK